MKPRIYSKEFKEETVRLSYQRDNLKDLANELGIKVDRIYDWRRALHYISGPSTLTTESKDSEIKLLKKQLREKEQELEILKKAVHIFSKSDGRSINL